MAFVGLPVAFFVTASGLGLLVDRAVRADLPNGLLVPVGFCVAVSLMLSVFKLGAHVELAVVVLVVASAAGFGLAGRGARRAIDLGPVGLAGLAVYLLYTLPMLGTGAWTWFGYNFVNDTAVQFLLVEHLKESGTATGSLPFTSGGETVRVFLASGYPLGTHSFAAALSGLLGQSIAVVYQAFLAAMAATAAMSLAVLARSLAGGRVAALLATVAMASNLTFQYALQGNIKEIGVVAALCVSAAVAAQVVRASRPLPIAVVLGLCLAAVLTTYNAAGLPYLGALGGATTVLVLAQHRRAALSRRWITAGVVAIGAMLVASIAALTTMSQFYDVASTVVSSASPAGEEFGALAHRMPLLQAAGVWLDGRYFEPIEPDTLRDALTSVAGWAVVALLILAIVEVVRRRRPEALLAIVPFALTATLVAPRVSPYADGKLLAILSPAVVLTAGFGLLFVWQHARPVGAVLAVGLVAAIGVSNGFAYHDVKPAPRDRMVAFEDVMENVPGNGLVFVNEFEEFAKYFDPDDRVNVSSESITPRPVQLLQPVARFGRWFDLDEQQLDYVQSFRHIVMRRSPAASRPPSSYRRIYSNDFYEAWQRDPERAQAVLHMPLRDEVSSATDTASCTDVRRLVRSALRLDEETELIAAQHPRTIRFDVADARDRSVGWPLNGVTPETVTIPGPGQARGVIHVPEGGNFFAWARGDLTREVQIQVDGRSIGGAIGVNTPGQWLPVGTVTLDRGQHAVRAFAGGGTLKPGDGALGLLGSISFVRQEPGRLLTVGLDDAESLCGRELDWIEVVPR